MDLRQVYYRLTGGPCTLGFGLALAGEAFDFRIILYVLGCFLFVTLGMERSQVLIFVRAVENIRVNVVELYTVSRLEGYSANHARQFLRLCCA